MNEQQISSLRAKAEKILERKLKDIAETYQHYDLEALLEEIAIYHTELEAQNEELREKQLELERSQQEHKLLYDHAPIGYVVLDGHFNIIQANIQACQDLNLHIRYPEIKKAFISYLGKGHLERLLDWLKDEVHLHDPLEIELLRGNEKRWFRLFRNHTPEDESYMMLSMVDIHEEKILKILMEEKIEEGIAKLREQQALMIQQSKMAEAGNMLEAIIHQWRQPLNIIVMAAGAANSVVCDPANKEEAESMEQTLLKQAHFMSETINDFRDFFQPKKQDVKLVPCQLLERIKQMFKGLFEKYSVEIVIEAHEHFQVMGRSSEFMQVLLNILNNARDAILEKYGSKGGADLLSF